MVKERNTSPERYLKGKMGEFPEYVETLGGEVRTIQSTPKDFLEEIGNKLFNNIKDPEIRKTLSRRMEAPILRMVNLLNQIAREQNLIDGDEVPPVYVFNKRDTLDYFEKDFGVGADANKDVASLFRKTA